MKRKPDIIGGCAPIFGALVALLVGLVLPAESAVLVLYTGEGDTAAATDQIVSDGSQNGTFSNDTVVNSDSKFGTSAYGFGGGTAVPDRIEIAGTSGTALGSSFTFAAYVKPSSLSLQRLFSNYAGSGAVGADQIIMDFDLDNNTAGFGLRLIVNGKSTSRPFSSTLSVNEYYHFAATYDNGTVKLYQNGVQMGANGSALNGSPNLISNLYVGEDRLQGSTAGWSEQLTGSVDEILIYNQALSAAAISWIAKNGVESWLSIPEPTSKHLMVIGFASLLFVRRQWRG